MKADMFMSRRTSFGLLAAALLAALLAAPAGAANLEHGKELFHACAACHTDKLGWHGKNAPLR